MKLEPETKIDKRNTASKKILTMTSYRQILKSLSFPGFIANLEQSWSQIPKKNADIRKIKGVFVLKDIFCETT